MFGADNPVSNKLTNVEIMTGGTTAYLLTRRGAAPLCNTLLLHVG
jgi:hypothetical protein